MAYSEYDPREDPRIQAIKQVMRQIGADTVPQFPDIRAEGMDRVIQGMDEAEAQMNGPATFDERFGTHPSPRMPEELDYTPLFEMLRSRLR